MEDRDRLSEYFYPPVKIAIKKILERDHPFFLDAREKNPKGYFKEHATIKLGLPRREGNSYIAKKIIDDFSSSLLVARTAREAEIAIRETGFAGRVFGVSNIERCEKKADILVFDESFWISKTFVEKIYDEIIEKIEAKVVIFLA